MKMVCILGEAADASLYTMIRQLQRVDFDLTVLAFERSIYSGKLKKSEYIPLGTISNRRYLRRLLLYLPALLKIIRVARKAEVLFSFRGLDLLLLSWIASKVTFRDYTLVHNIADIQDVFIGDSWLSYCLRSLERFLLNRTDIIVVTSEAYITGYFQAIQHLDRAKFCVIENKIAPEMIASLNHLSNGSISLDKKFRIGYFGLLRCLDSWSVLKAVVERESNSVSLYLRGVDQGLNINEYSNKTDAIHYAGPYFAPDDLAHIYNEVDIIWAAVHHANANIRWSRVHRFYQACYFGKPIIAQKGTPDGDAVQNFDIGLVVDVTNIPEAVESILNIRQDDLTRWKSNIRRLPKSVHTLTNEYQELKLLIEFKHRNMHAN